MNYGWILIDFLLEDYYDYIIVEVFWFEYVRLVDKFKGKVRGGGGGSWKG